MENQSKHVVIACGGTGGHLFPGIAVAQELKARGHSARLLISEKKVDAQASEKYKDFDFDTVPAVAKPSTLSLKMLPFLWNVWKTSQQCKALLKRSQTDVVIGMGGFTSLPPVLAAKRLGLQTYVHDSNALPGKANRLTAKFCTKVMLGLEAAVPFFPKSECVVTGTPVREELSQSVNREEVAERYGLSTQKPTVLVMGGSQGAKQLNTFVVEASRALPEVQFLHMTGNFDYDRVSSQVTGVTGHKVIAFCDDMAAAYALSDLVLCRSGASSMTELAYLGLPSILVPYPYAADDHQTKNAEVFEQKGAALLRQETDIDAGSLVADISRLLGNEETLELMSRATSELAVKDAVQQICKVIEQV